MKRIQIRAWLVAALLGVCLLAGCMAASQPGLTASSEADRVSQTASTAFAVSDPSGGEISLLDESGDASSDLPQRTTAEWLAERLPAGTAEADLSFLHFVEDTFGTAELDAVAEAVRDGRYSEASWRACTGNSLQVLLSLYRKEPDRLANVRLMSLGSRGSDKTTVMTFGGDICFADNYVVMKHLKTTENGLADCIAPEWFAEMQKADLAVLNNEFTISDRGTPMANKMYTFRAAVANTALYQALGVDFVTLANNHAFDFGKDAFLDTLDALRAHGIDYAGGGRNAEEAQRPFYYLVDGRKVALISATRAEKYILTPEAGSDSPGVFRCYDPARLLDVIAEAKANSDYVILLIHWGTEHSDRLEPVQETTSHAYIDAGADLIVGAHAHQLQGIEFYSGKAIFYNLGNFWFDEYRIETGLLRLELAADGSEAFTFLPGLQENCVTSYELGTPVGREILAHLASYRAGVRIDAAGRVRPAGEDT